MNNQDEVDEHKNVTYLFKQEVEHEEYSDDPLDDLLNEFGTEDPEIIKIENEIYELTQAIQSKHVKSDEDRRTLAQIGDLEDTILKAQKILNEIKYYQTYSN